MIRILTGDCRDLLATLDAESIDSCVTDPPYHLTSIVKRFGSETAAPAKAGKTGAYARASKGFMGQKWDGGDVAFQRETWAAVWRVLKPGAHLVAFSGTRTYHRMVCAIEDAGFEIRDQLAWIYGSGFPKSHDIAKGMTRNAAGRETVLDCFDAQGRNVGCMEALEWAGWGTALKPAWEPICLARKPISEANVAANVHEHHTGAINIDGCRIEADWDNDPSKRGFGYGFNNDGYSNVGAVQNAPPVKEVWTPTLGRWPANIIHDGSDEVLAHFPESDGASGAVGPQFGNKDAVNAYGDWGPRQEMLPRGDSGSAARFFYQAKATTAERGEGNNHPTVKPVDLMRWLCRLVTPKGGTVLDPFTGSGSTLIAADAEQFHAIGCELSPEYVAIAERRIRDSAGMFAEVLAA